MKKIRLIVLVLLLAAVTVCLSACTGNKADDKFAVEGVFLVGKSEFFIITDDGEPIILSDRTESDRKIFDGLENGDRISVTTGLIEETYPARADLYEIRLLEKGKSENINTEILDRLKESGWVE